MISACITRIFHLLIIIVKYIHVDKVADTVGYIGKKTENHHGLTGLRNKTRVDWMRRTIVPRRSTYILSHGCKYFQILQKLVGDIFGCFNLT